MNSISITGRLAKDAELKQVGDNKVASFSIVHDVQVKGEKVAMFYDASVWGKRAEVAAQYLKKGGTITIIGKLMPVYVSGEKAYLKVDVQDFTLPPRAAAPAAQSEDDRESPAPARQSAPAARPAARLPVADDDEIPF